MPRPSTAAIAETGATSAKDMGKVMKAVMAGLAGKTVDGKKVSEAVKAKLGLNPFVPRLFTTFTRPGKHFGRVDPSIYFERPSQPLTILLRAPTERSEPYFFASHYSACNRDLFACGTTFHQRTRTAMLRFC